MLHPNCGIKNTSYEERGEALHQKLTSQQFTQNVRGQVSVAGQSRVSPQKHDYRNRAWKSNQENKATLEKHTGETEKSRQKDVCSGNYKCRLNPFLWL